MQYREVSGIPFPAPPTLMTSGTRLTWSFVLVVLGGALAWIGLEFGIDLATGGAVAVFGAAFLLAGLDSIVTRSHRTGDSMHSAMLPREHRGWPAVVYGVTFVLPGTAMMFVGALIALGLGDSLLGEIFARPAPVFMLAGVVACLAGIATVASKWSASTSAWQRLPGQVVGVFITAMGIGLIAIGRVFASEPGGPRAAMERIGKWVIGVLSSVS